MATTEQHIGALQIKIREQQQQIENLSDKLELALKEVINIKNYETKKQKELVLSVSEEYNKFYKQNIIELLEQNTNKNIKHINHLIKNSDKLYAENTKYIENYIEKELSIFAKKIFIEVDKRTEITTIQAATQINVKLLLLQKQLKEKLNIDLNMESLEDKKLHEREFKNAIELMELAKKIGILK